MTEITKQTFSQLPVEAKLDVLFDIVSERCEERHQHCLVRFAKIEDRSWATARWAIVAAFAGGIIGGATKDFFTMMVTHLK